jgi:pyrroline-5-carboxylate reductase
MPTQVARVGAGVTLVCHNAKTTATDREFITTAFRRIGAVKEISESQFSLAADLSSCAPAFYAAICRSLCAAAGRHGALTPEEIKEISVATLYGTAKLLQETGESFSGLIKSVATPGGISEEGVKILDRTLPAVFDEVLSVTLSKRRKVLQQMHEQYGLKPA